MLRAISPEQIVVDDPLGKFHIEWDNVPKEHIEEFMTVLNSAKTERSMQDFIQKRPIFLAQSLRGGHGRWVIPQKRLGAEYVTDFVVGEKSSSGFKWYGVELESPKACMFNSKGDPSRTLTHAIRQIMDWRSWLGRNQNYASRTRVEKGLGLTDISPSLEGLIIIGRRQDIDPETNSRRRQLEEDTRIQIHTYDWLLKIARK